MLNDRARSETSWPLPSFFGGHHLKDRVPAPTCFVCFCDELSHWAFFFSSRLAFSAAIASGFASWPHQCRHTRRVRVTVGYESAMCVQTSF